MKSVLDGYMVPSGWTLVRVADVGEVRLGRQRSPKHHSGPHMRPYLRVANVYEARIDTSDVQEMNFSPEEYETYRLEPGDLLLNEGQSLELVGRPAIFRGEVPGACFQNTLVRFRAREAVLPEFALIVFRAYLHLGVFQMIARWTTSIAHLGAQRFADLPFPLPPISEQRAIVEAVDSQLTRLDAAAAALERAQANLKRYRASVLKAACEGRLVPTEAELARREGRDYEPADMLLQRILRERRPADEAKGPDIRILPALPEGWAWTRVDQVGTVQLGRQRAPKHHKGPNMRPYLRVANVYEDRIDLADVLSMNFTPAEFEVYQLQHGDILLNEGQSLELVGRPAMFRGEIEGACFQNTLIRFRSAREVLPDYALTVFRSYLHDGTFQRIASWTTTIAHLGAARFAELHFPLPPIAEQKRIAEEVSRRLSALSFVENTLALGSIRSGRLRRSILKRAFEGKLVPQGTAT